MKTPRGRRVALVVWDDAHAVGENWGKWELKDHKPRRIHSIGYVMRDDEVGVTLVQSIDAEKNDDHGLFVPRCNVVETVTLTEES